MFSVGFTYILAYLIIGLIFCLYNSIVLREIMEYVLDHHDKTFYTSLIVAFYITIYMLFNSLMSPIWWLNIIFMIVFVLFFIKLVKIEYLITNKEAIVMFFWWFLSYALLAFMGTIFLSIRYYLARA